MSQRAPAMQDADDGAGGLNILLADDTHGERMRLETFLHGLGHAVRTAEDGAQALELFVEDEIDLVLLDTVMPVLDGIEATRRLKARCRARWVPVILLGDQGGAADPAQALEAGADDYLYQPVNLALLGARLRSFQRIVHAMRLLAHHRREAQAEAALAAAMIEGIARHHQDGLRDPALTWVVHPSRHFSGDAVAAARTPSGSLVAMLGDATGHGLPAAISLLPMLQVFYGMARRDLRLPEMAGEMNRRLKEYAPPGIYLAAALVAVHPRERRVEVWNGGIPGGLWLCDGRAEAAPLLASRHLPLGILDDAQFNPGCVQADTGRGARILFFSDGLLEACSPGGEAFGQARLLAQLAAAAPEEGFARTLQAVEDHLAGRAAHDDISLMMIALDAP